MGLEFVEVVELSEVKLSEVVHKLLAGQRGQTALGGFVRRDWGGCWDMTKCDVWGMFHGKRETQFQVERELSRKGEGVIRKRMPGYPWRERERER